MQRSVLMVILCGSLLGAFAFSNGCKDDRTGTSVGPGFSSNGTTAVVDLDKMFRELGYATKLQANSETYGNQLKNDFTQFQQRYESQLQQHMKDMIPPGVKEGEKYNLTQSQSQDLANYVYAARQQVQALQQEAQQHFNNYRAQWVRQYRDALSPIVREVAQDKRMNIVMVQNETLIYADRTVDLTDAVVDAARKQPPNLTEVPMQRLQGAPDIHPQQAPPPLTQPATQPMSAPPMSAPPFSQPPTSQP